MDFGANMDTQYQPVSNKPRKIQYSETLLCNDLYVNPYELWRYGAYIERKYVYGEKNNCYSQTITYNQMFPNRETAEKFIRQRHYKTHNMEGLEEYCIERLL